jgi:hypothetical protein
MVLFSHRRIPKQRTNGSAWSGNASGKVRPETVIARCVEMAYPVGHYELRSYAGGKLVWNRVQGGATEALASLNLAQKRDPAVAMADDAGVQVVLDPERVALRDAGDVLLIQFCDAP